MIRIFGKPKEVEVLKLVERQALIARDAVRGLKELYLTLRDGRWGEALEKAYEIAMLEREADSVREEVAAKIFGEAWLPEFREAIMMLIEDIDNVADSAKDVARILTHRKFNTAILNRLEPDLEVYVGMAVRAGDLIAESIRILPKDMNAAVKTAKKIEEIEMKVDEVKMMLLSRLYELEDEANILTLLQIKDVILFIDNLVDKAEDFSDTMELVYLSFKA